MKAILAESGDPRRRRVALAACGKLGWMGSRGSKGSKGSRGSRGSGGSGKGDGASGNGPPGTQCHPPAQGRQRQGFASRCPLAMARLPALPTLDAADLVGVGSRKGVASPLYLVRSFNRIAPNSPMHG